MRTINHWINNAEVGSTSGNFGPVYNPATGEQQAQVGLASVSEVDVAVAAAKEPKLRFGGVVVARSGAGRVAEPRLWLRRAVWPDRAPRTRLRVHDEHLGRALAVAHAAHDNNLVAQ